MKKTTALALAILMGLSILAAWPSDSQAKEENICDKIWYRCMVEVMLSDQGPIATCHALEACEMKRILCYIFLFL